MTIIQANKFYFQRGGAERYLFDLSAWLAARGHTVVPFAMQHPDNLSTPYANFFPSEVKTERVKFGWQGLRTAGRMFYSLEARRNLSTLMVKTHPNILHVHNIYGQLSPSILDTARVLRVPVVMTVHDHHLVSPQYNLWAPGCGINYQHIGIINGTLARFHKQSAAASFAQVATYKFHRWLRIYERGVDRFMCPSNYLAKQLIAGGYDKDKIRVNSYGINPSTTKANFDHQGYILFVGRLSAEKGIETLLEAAARLPDLPFRIVGTGPDEVRLHTLGHHLPNVTFVGFRDGEMLKDEYRGALAVAVPSRVNEVFPLVVLEAMAAGKPVVASHVGGMSEVVEDRRTGLLVPPLDINAWVEAFDRLALDEDFRHALAKQSRLAVETTFHISHHHERLLKIYEEVAPGQW